MKKIIKFFCFLFLVSCKKENYIDTIKNGNLTTKVTYKEGRITNSKIYELDKLDTEYIYNNGNIIKIYQYYPNTKIHYSSSLTKAPNHYSTIEYYENGVVAAEGDGYFFKTKKIYLRSGGWIFYNKSGQAYSILEFANDGEKEYLQQETIYDTIKRKIIKDVKYENPILVN